MTEQHRYSVGTEARDCHQVSQDIANFAQGMDENMKQEGHNDVKKLAKAAPPSSLKSFCSCCDITCTNRFVSRHSQALINDKTDIDLQSDEMKVDRPFSILQ